MDIGRATQTEVDHAGAGGRVGEAVDENERAGLAILRVRVERDRRRGREVAQADLVERQRARRDVLQRIDIDLVLAGS